MSYEIVYSKQFIKVEGGIIPLVLAGSNNCWDANNRRERSWGVFFNGFAKRIMTTDEITQYIEKLATTSDTQEFFVKGGKWITADRLKAFYKSGIKNAKTIEQIIADGKQNKWRTPSLEVKLSFCGRENDAFKQYNIETRAIHTTEELEKAIAELLPRADGKSIFLGVRFDANEPITFKPTSKAFNGRALLKYKNSYVVKSDVLHRMTTTKNKDQATIFNSFEDADAYRKTLGEYFANEVKIVKYTPSPTREYFIRFTDANGNDGYLVKATRGGGFRYSYTPSKAFTHSEAEKMIQNITARRNDCNFRIVS